MFIRKENRRTILRQLFKDGVLWARKDFLLPKHPEVGVPNVEVIKLMTSLVSREYVKEKFSWRHYYWVLTDAGIDYLREYLHIPPEVVPNTQKKTGGDRPQAPSGMRSGRGGRGRGRGGYRESAGGYAKKLGGDDFGAPSF